MSIRQIEHADVVYFTTWTSITLNNLDGSMTSLAYYQLTECIFSCAVITINPTLSIKVNECNQAWDQSVNNSRNTAHLCLGRIIRQFATSDEVVLNEPIHSMLDDVCAYEPFCEFTSGLHKEPYFCRTFKEISEGHYVRA